MSPSGFAQRFAGISKVMTAFVVLALLAAVALVLNNGDGKRYMTIDFEQTNSVYEGSDVKVLGVPVGKVETLTPRGDVVRATVSYDGKYRLPNDVKAVVVSPSIVGDRFVQLAPAYSGSGAVLKDKAFIPVDRTAVPIELDAVYQSLDDLSIALGPKGANKDGSLSSLVDGTAKQLDGQGAQLNETIQNFSKLSTTLSNNKDELFGSLREVRDFVSLLKTNDSAVRSFNDSTAKVSTVLAGERDDLKETLRALSLALVDVNSLVKENRGKLRSNIDNIASLAALLAKHEKDLEEITIGGPTALTNVSLAYNGTSGTLDTRADINEIFSGALSNPASLVCNLLGETIDDAGLCASLSGVLGGVLDGLPEAPLPRTAASSSGTAVPERVNTSVADMLAVN
ncbi:virulence factor Mce [Aeromicrobium sp. A1-2]|uniref:MCE family protein n=1 Tax=Aeromicrobium sp. A1-2 TaxID=2107713 RepID=UPI000E537951|nr:MCE family protein [Aeromicrobium sp. A1-2]AXT83963.1 virulence factor Mce [Aeromicrobium sp. A1-2]